MKKTMSVVSVAVMAFGLAAFGGCKPTCEKAVANIRELAKADPEFQKRIGDEKDEELIAECNKDAAKNPDAIACMTNAKSIDDLKKCSK